MIVATQSKSLLFDYITNVVRYLYLYKVEITHFLKTDRIVYNTRISTGYLEIAL